MKVIIESSHFEPGIILQKFINERAELFFMVNKQVEYVEFHLSKHANGYSCMIILSLPERYVVEARSSPYLYYSVIRAMKQVNLQLSRMRMKQWILKNKCIAGF